jgi:hypothetical protein
MTLDSLTALPEPCDYEEQEEENENEWTMNGLYSSDCESCDC